jgi:hypothetical protein
VLAGSAHRIKRGQAVAPAARRATAGSARLQRQAV